MKMRWLAAGVTAVLVIGGAATVAQRVITQKTRGVLVLAVNSDAGQSVPKKTEALTLADDPSRPPMPVAAPSNPGAIPPPDLGRSNPDLVSIGSIDSNATEATRPPLTPTVAFAEISTPTATVIEADPAVSPTSSSAMVTPAEPTPAEPARDSPAPSPGEIPSKLDPVDSVETFVERNRKEAESAILALTTESENLKNRLSKVESALARWQSFSRALNADQPVAQPTIVPGTKLKWNRPDSETSTQPIRGIVPDLPQESPLGSPPNAQPSEPSTASQVPSGPDAATQAPGAAKPNELPPSDPATFPPSSRN